MGAFGRLPPWEAGDGVEAVWSSGDAETDDPDGGTRSDMLETSSRIKTPSLVIGWRSSSGVEG